MEEEAEKPKKKFLSCRNCCLFVVFLAFLFFLGIAAVFAKAGMVKIPILSNLLYKEPEEIVQPDLNAEKRFEKELQEIQEEARKEGKMSEQIELELSQEELLGLAVLQQKKLSIPLDKPQIVIHTYQVEAWARIDISQATPDFPLKGILSKYAWVKVTFLPLTTGQKVDFLIKKVQIGCLSLPQFVANRIINALQKAGLKLSYQLEGLRSLELEEGRIIVVIEPQMFEK